MAVKKRSVYHIVPVSDPKGWYVKLEGVKQAVAVYETKDLALTAARGMVQANLPGQIILHKRDGRIQKEYNYALE